jgi:hypothetical protein
VSKRGIVAPALDKEQARSILKQPVRHLKWSEVKTEVEVKAEVEVW